MERFIAVPHIIGMITIPKSEVEQPEGEHRDDARHRTLRKGRVLINDLHSSFDVIVRDVSEEGMQLKLWEVWAVPETFDLELLSPYGHIEAIYQCERRWQNGLRVGVHILADKTDQTLR